MGTEFIKHRSSLGPPGWKTEASPHFPKEIEFTIAGENISSCKEQQLTTLKEEIYSLWIKVACANTLRIFGYQRKKSIMLEKQNEQFF